MAIFGMGESICSTRWRMISRPLLRGSRGWAAVECLMELRALKQGAALASLLTRDDFEVWHVVGYLYKLEP